MCLRAASFFIAAILLIAGSAKAQFAQYTPPGGPEDRPEDRKERLEREIEEARYRLGPVRVDPVLSFRDVVYVRDLFASEGPATSDVTATAGAGFRAYLRTGRKVTWIGHVVPEYVWWRKQENARRLNQRFGLTSLGFFNRLTLEALAQRDEQQQIVSPEVPRLIHSRGDRAGVDAELKASGALYVFASASRTEVDNLVDEEDDPRVRALGLLDHGESLARLGVRWRPRSGWTVGLGVERSVVDFESQALDNSNSGTAPVLEVVLDRRRFLIQADVAARSLEARQGSRFVPFDGVTGGASVTYEPGQRLGISLYGSRNLVYSLSLNYPYLDDHRLGLALSMGLGRSANFRFFQEIGYDDYVPSLPTLPDQRDDLSAYGGSFRWILPGPGTAYLTLQAVRFEFDSNLPGADRSYTTGGITISLGGDVLNTR